MRRIVLLAAAVVVVGACGERPSSEPRAPGQLAPEDLTGVEREAFVYAAAIRHLVDGLPQEPRVIYVLDRALPEGATAAQAAPIPRGVQDRVREELALLGPIRFVADRAEVAVEGSQRIEAGGVFIALGPVPRGRDRVEVEASIVGTGARQRRATLVLRRNDLRWGVESVR